MRPIASLVTLAAVALVAAGCAGGTVDIAPAVDELNATLAEAGVSATCPDGDVEAPAVSHFTQTR